MAMASRFLLQLHHTGGITSTVIPAVARLNSQLGYNHVPRGFHNSSAFCKGKSDSANFQEIVKHAIEQKSTSLVTDDELFKQAARDAKNKASFNRVLDVFIKRDIRRRGHVEFIYAALKKMPEFGVERDITIYNKLLDVFPKEVFVPSNYIQIMFMHYPRQQECGVQVLEQMEHYGVMPNMETKVLLVQIFGEKGHPFRKYQRLMYWFPKFKNLNPFPVPHQLSQDPMDLARFSLTHIANDLDAKITVYQFPTTDITEAGEEVTHPYILGIQSPDQRSLLAKHSPKKPVFVEGPFPLWLRNICVHYYLLRADPVPPEEQIEEELDPEMVGPEQSFFYPHYIDLDLKRDLGDDDCFDVDDVVEGPVYAMCMTEQGDQATLAKWISGLQENNPILGKVPTVFRLESGFGELEKVENIHHDSGQNQQPKDEAVHIIDEEVLHSQGMKR